MRIFAGYGLITIGVVLAVVILFYIVIGFSYKNGVLIRNGMIFVSSSPSNANIMLNGQPVGTTNKRFIVEAGKYQISLSRTGYRPWQRTIILQGGRVQHYDYPLLIPDNLTSSSVLDLSGQPSLVTESPNQQLLLISSAINPLDFKLVNISSPQQPVTTDLVLPSNVITKATSSESWQLVEWSSDNQHVLLRHDFDGKYEYVVLDTTDPTKSVNLEAAFGQSIDDATLFNQQYDQYWFYDSAKQQLSLANLSGPTVQPYLSKVLAYKSYADDIVLYVTSSPSGKLEAVWYQGGQKYVIATGLPSAQQPSDYLLDLSQFNGDWYVAVGVDTGNDVAVYKDPLAFIGNYPNKPVPAYYIMKIAHPNYLKFSSNAQFILAENGLAMSVFNARYHTGYSYELDGLDAPQAHVTWMDGYHLLYVYKGQLQVIDFNDINRQTLVGASSSYLPFIDANEEFLFTLSGTTQADGSPGTTMYETPLRLPADI